MKILELYDREAPTGVATIATRIGYGLLGRGFEVLFMRSGSAVRSNVIAEDACFNGGALNDARLVRRLRNLIVSEDIDVIHAHHRRLALVAKVAAAGRNVPVVEHVHSVFTDKKLASFRADAVVALAPELAGDIAQRYPHTQGRVFVCPNGVEIPALAPALPRNEPIHALGVGRLEPAKDPMGFGDLIRRINASGLAVRGTWLGDGPLHNAMKSRYGDVVKLEGSVPNISPWLRQTDCLISASVREGLPLSVLEAMASGRPVIARAVGAIPGLLNGGAGLVWGSKESPEELAIRASKFLSDSDALLQASALARQTVENGYSVTVMLDAIVQILERVAE